MQSQNNVSTFLPANLSVTVVDGRPMVNSLVVAEAFLKDHRRVLQDIREIIADGEDEDFYTENYLVHDLVHTPEHFDSQGKARTVYYMTEEGFDLLALSYTGPTAKRFKIAFIREFVRMRNEISELKAKQAAQNAQHKLMVKEKVRPLDWVQDPHTTFLRLYRNMDRMLDIGHFKHLNPEITTAKDAFNRILSKYESK